MSRARDLSKLVNPSLFSVDTSNNLGVNSTSPDAKLDVVGIVSATAFYGDGSNLEGVASAGLGTALGEEGGLEVIYYTDNVLTVGSTITVDPPSTTNVAYTQYTEIAVSGDADLIVADGDDLVPDILGLSTEGVSPIVGSGGRVRADNFTSHSGNGAPTFPNGANVTGVVTATSVSATSGSFSGNVSVGGTLTYEDVTNVDSVGMITARKGIQVLADGINAVGVVTATSFSGDGSALSGIQAGVADFVAYGTIPNGATVVVRSDGKVGIVTIAADALSGGTPTTFSGGTCQHISATFDSNSNKVVIAYEDNSNSNYGTAVVGTVSGTSISFGTPVVYGSFDCNYNSITFDSSNNKVVIAYYDGTNTRGQCIVGTVSGTSISFGSPTSFISNNANPVRCTYVGSGKVVVIYRDGSDGYYGKAIVGTVSGTSISFGSQVQFNGGNTPDLMPVYDSNAGKVVISYSDAGNNQYPTAIVGTVSGTSISFGSENAFASVTSYDNCAVFDSTNNKVVVAYVDSDDGSAGKAAVGTVSGTSISFGSIVEFGSNVNYISMAYDSTNDRVHIKYADDDNSGYGTAIDGAVSGTNISFGTPYVFLSNNMYYAEEGSTFDSNAGKVVHAFRAPIYGQAVVMTSTSQQTNLDAGNYIGMAAAGISSGATGPINIVSGINTSRTGLTTGRTYYVQTDGSLGLTAANPSVVAGTSISSTKIIVKG